MNLKTTSDMVHPRGFFVDLDELYKLPYRTNLLQPSHKQLFKKKNLFEKFKIEFCQHFKNLRLKTASGMVGTRGKAVSRVEKHLKASWTKFVGCTNVKIIEV